MIVAKNKTLVEALQFAVHGFFIYHPKLGHYATEAERMQDSKVLFLPFPNIVVDRFGYLCDKFVLSDIVVGSDAEAVDSWNVIDYFVVANEGRLNNLLSIAVLNCRVFRSFLFNKMWGLNRTTEESDELRVYLDEGRPIWKDGRPRELDYGSMYTTSDWELVVETIPLHERDADSRIRLEKFLEQKNIEWK
jgi:hypothetical protein